MGMRQTARSAGLTALILSAVGGVSTAGARTFYVTPPTGRAKAPAAQEAAWGTKTNPFQSLHAAEAVVSAGDTVAIAEGEYYGTEPLVCGKAGDDDAPIVYRGLGKGVRTSGIAYNVVNSNRTFENMEVTGAQFGFCIWGSGDQSLHGIKIRNCTIYGNQRCAVYVSNESDPSRMYDVLVENCRAYDNCRDNADRDIPGEQGWPGALQTNGASRVIFRNNRIYNNYGEGITFTHVRDCEAYGNVIYDNYSVNMYFDMAQECIVRDNLIYSTGDSRFDRYDGLGRARGIQCSNEKHYFSNRNGRIYNNIVINCSVAFDASWSSNGASIEGFTVSNNVFYGSVGKLLNITSTSGTNTFVNNVFVASGGGMGTVSGAVSFSRNCWHGGSAARSGDGDVNADPGFIDAGTGKFDPDGYKLRSSSPCIDAGTSLSAYSTDFSNAQRPHGNSWDIGAFEYGGEPSTVQPGAPYLALSVASMDLETQEGRNPDPRTFEVWNGGGDDAVTFTVSADQSWIRPSVSSASAGSSSSKRSIEVRFPTASLAPGTYEGTIVIASEGLEPKTIAVSVGIGGNATGVRKRNGTSSAARVRVSPDGALMISVIGGSDGTAKARVCTIDGRVVAQVSFPAGGGESMLRRSSVRLAPGSYVVRLRCGALETTRRVVLP